MAVELLEHAYLTDLVNLIHAEKSDANHLCVGRALPTFCRTVSSSSPPRMFRLECSDISTLQKRCLRPSCQVFDILGDRISCSLSRHCVSITYFPSREREREIEQCKSPAGWKSRKTTSVQHLQANESQPGFLVVVALCSPSAALKRLRERETGKTLHEFSDGYFFRSRPEYQGEL